MISRHRTAQRHTRSPSAAARCAHAHASACSSLQNRRPQFVSLPFLLLAILSPAAAPAALNLNSPGLALFVTIHLDARQQLHYSIRRGGLSVLEPSPLGILIGSDNLGKDVALGPPTSQTVRETYPWLGAKNSATNHCNAYVIPVHHPATSTSWTLEVRVFDDGAAYRYRVPGTANRRLMGESSAWSLPPGSRVWFQSNIANNENEYESSPPEAIPQTTAEGQQSAPLHLGLPVTVELAAGPFLLISEADLENYSGLALRPTGTRLLDAAFPHDPNGWSASGPVVSPWRVILISTNLHALVNSDVIPSLNPPPDPKQFPKGPHTDWIRPGRALDTWTLFGNDGAQWHRQKWFVDQCAALRCEFLLRDQMSLTHYTALPFTRMAVGDSDFLPGYVRPKYLKNTTATFQIATAIIATSPFLCWPDHPDDYIASPFAELIKRIPVAWDETLVLPGSRIGNLVVFARRSGSSWFVGILNGLAEPRTHSLDFAFLGHRPVAATFYADHDPWPEGVTIDSRQSVTSSQSLPIKLAPGGGFVAWLEEQTHLGAN
jgi:hypothetical protein